MADLDYSVGVAGLKDLKELEARIKSLDTLLKKPIDASGLNSIAAALRKVQGASGASDTVAAEVRKLRGVAEELKTTFKGTGDAIAGVLRSELSKTAASIRMDVVALGERAVGGLGEATSKQLKEETRKIKGAAALAKAELNAAYNNLVGEGNGREYIRDPGKLAIVRALRDQGATISGVHNQQLKLLDDNAKELADAAKRSAATQSKAILDQANAVAAAEDRAAQLMASRRAGRVKGLVSSGSAGAAAETMFAQQMRQEEAAAKAATAALDVRRAAAIAALTAGAGAGKGAAGGTALAQMLREEDAAAKAATAALDTRRGAAVAALTAGAGSGKGVAGGTLLAQMLREEAAAAKAATAALETRAHAMTKAATINATSNYSSLSTGKLVDPNVANINAAATAARNAKKAMDEGNKSALGLSEGFRKVSTSGADLHAMSRGLASGFGALWMTWGNLVPLLAGAAISHSLMETAKQGMAVAHSLEVISALGIGTSITAKETTAQMQQLTNSMIELGKHGPFGPMEVAEAMKTLSLAGLEASKIASVLPKVLNFSLAGDTSITEAADVLVSVTTAFGTGAMGFERSSDIIMRAAADSKASVESFGSAMKTASVVGEQFNASQEDVAVMIQYLANLGIQGTAAGTAIRNMYADLSGRSGQTSKIIKQLGMDFRDTATGGIKPITEVAKELYTVLQGYDAISQKNIMQAIFSERGGKAIIEVMAQYSNIVKQAGGDTNKLAQDIEKFTNAAGESAVAAIKMGETTQNAWKSVGAALNTTMFEAFKQLEPQLYLTAKAMQDAFNSPELRQALVSLGSAVLTVTKYVADNAVVIAQAAAAYAAMRVSVPLMAGVLGGLSTVVQASTKHFDGKKKALDGAIDSQNRASESLKILAATETAAGAATLGRTAKLVSFGSKVLNVIPIVGNVVAGGALAWSLYDMFMGKASDTAKDYVDVRADNVVKALKEEADKLAELNTLRAKGLTLAEAEIEVSNRKAKNDLVNYQSSSRADVSSVIAAKEAELQKMTDERARLVASLPAGMNANSRAVMLASADANFNRVTGDIETMRGKLVQLDKEAENRQKELDHQQARIKGETKAAQANNMREAKEAMDAQNRTMEQLAKGTKTFNIADFQAGQRKGGKGDKEFERADLERNNELKALETFYTARASVLEASYTKESRFLDMRREGEILSESEYIAKSFQMATKYENDRIAMAVQKSEEYLTIYAGRQQRMREAMEAAKDPVTKDIYKQQLEKEQNEAKAFTEKTVAEIEKIKIESNARVEQSFLKLESTAFKLMKTDKEFWEKRKRDTSRKKEAEDLEKAYENINQSVFSTGQAQYAQAKATLEVKQATEEHIQELVKQVEIQEAILKALEEELRIRMQLSGQDPVQMQTLMDGVNRASETLGKLRDRMSSAVSEGVTEGSEAGSRAFNEQMDKQARGFRNALTDSAVTALLDGGKEGGKKLRDYLQEELLRKPLTVMINGLLQGILGNFGGGLAGLLGGALFGGGGGGGSGAGGIAGQGASMLANHYLGGNGMIGTVGGWLGWGGSSGAMYGTTAYANLVGAAGGDSLGAFIGANNYWGGVGAGASSGAGAGAAGAGANSGGAGFGMGGAAAFAAVIVAAYLGGMFKEEKQVGQGITGQLGGDLYGYQLMRESGSLVSGPDYRYVIAEKEIKKADEEIARLKKEIEENPGARENGYKERQLQNLYSRRDRLQELYSGSMEAMSAPIKALNDSFKAMRENTATMADTLGLDGAAIRAMNVTLGLDEIHPDTGGKGLDLSGLTQEEAQAKIQAALEQANEEMARSVLGEWKEVTRDVTRTVWETVDVDYNTGGDNTNTQARVAREVTETITENVFVMSEYVREGETAVQALTRLSSSLVLVNGWFETIGQTAYATSLAGADMASQLIDAFGGAENFTTATNAYLQGFYTDTERVAMQTAGLGKQFKAIGVEMPANREAFRALAESQDLTTESGRKTYAALLQLAGATDQLYTAAEQAKEALKSMLQTLSDELLEAQGRYKELVTAQHNRKLEELRKTGGQEAVDMQLWIWYYDAQNYLRKQEIEILKAQGKELEAVALEREMELKQIEVYGDKAVENAKKLWALQDEAKARADQEAAAEKRRKQLYDQLTASINREKAALEKTRDASQEVIANLQAVVDAAKDAARELYNTIDSTAAKQTEEARESIKAILATLKSGGKAPTSAVMSGAISQARTGLSSENFLTEYEYQRQTLVLAGHLAQIGELTDGSLTIEEQVLEGINKQIEQFDATLEYYEKQLGLGQEGIDATMSVGQAVANIEAYLRGVREEDKKAAVGGTGGTGGTPTAPKDPWGADYYQPGKGGATLGGVTEGATRNPVIGYTKDGKAIYKDGTTEKYAPGEYAYDGNQLTGTGSLTSEQWARLQAGQEPFPGYWAGGKYNSNGKYTWNAGQNMYVPSFDTGINVLPNDTLAMLHKGEAVVPAKYNEFNPNANSVKDDEMMKVLQLILKEVSTQTGVQALNVELQEKIHDLLDTVTEGGNAMRSVNMETIEVKIVEIVNGVM